MSRAFERGEDLGCRAIQIFVKNPNQWQGPELIDNEVDAFLGARRASPIGPVAAHAAYLINLAATDPQVLERSRQGLADELERCRRLGVDALVVHPGSHLGTGEEAGCAAVAASIDEVLAEVPADGTDGGPRLLLENTAGQGTNLGHRLEHLETILASTASPERLGICLDTCHAFAAGYPLHEPAGHDALLDELDRRVGLDRLQLLHLNDSVRPFGSRRDRHAHIGQGEIGRDAFARLLRDPRLAATPMVIETETGKNREGHRRDLAVLRELLDR